jgi:hypothetical protein
MDAIQPLSLYCSGYVWSLDRVHVHPASVYSLYVLSTLFPGNEALFTRAVSIPGKGLPRWLVLVGRVWFEGLVHAAKTPKRHAEDVGMNTSWTGVGAGWQVRRVLKRRWRNVIVGDAEACRELLSWVPDARRGWFPGREALMGWVFLLRDGRLARSLARLISEHLQLLLHLPLGASS